jgi:hypothetical protein
MAGLGVSLLLLLLPWTVDYVRTCLLSTAAATVRRYAGSNFSWDAYVASLGIKLPQAIPMIAALGIAIWTGIKKGFGPAGWGIIHCMTLVAMPVVWDHAFTMAFLPVSVLIGVLVVRKSRIVPDRTWRGRLLDGIIVIWFLSEIGNSEFYYIRASPLSYMLTLVPLLTPPVLTISLWVSDPEIQPHSV